MSRPVSDVVAVQASQTSSKQYLTFFLNGEEYGVDILRVREIRGWSNPTAIPNTPLYIKGVINIRGEVVTIADLRERFGLPRLAHGSHSVIVVLRVMSSGQERAMGVVVDAMSDVVNIPQAAIKAPPELDSCSGELLVSAIAALDTKLIMLLDVDRVFDV